ncbi:hypothetical protein [Salipiger sp. PrR003]|uniref:hypothetical protein n=1 Tax=Salipiger sp. PrR003 TaxID=2706776 RepID=UPI0013DB0DDB|nr:hypothetical protein [Salipiger sp. PrR003]NDV50139.1 hypothetical protein [Salipiger sp. PrR003]
MRIHTLGSVAGLVAFAALAGCIIPDDYEATIALAENSVQLAFSGDLVNAPVHAEYMSGKPQDEAEVREFVEEYMAGLVEQGGFTNVSQKYVEGGRMNVQFEADATDMIRKRGRDGYIPLPGVTIYEKVASGGATYEIEFAKADAKTVSELAKMGIDVSGEVCIETELELAEMSPGDWVKEDSGGWFSSSKSYCIDTTLTPRDRQRISFYRSGGNS